MFEELINMLRKVEGDLEEVLSDLHHLRAFIQDEKTDGGEREYILKVLDSVISKLETSP